MALIFPPASRAFLEPHLPPSESRPRPFITLTFATSLDSQLSLSPGMQTILSGLESKAMTHYLRSRHDAILVGVGTAVADDPGLTCRLDGIAEGLEDQPRPVVVDPKGRWEMDEESRVVKLAREGKGKGVWMVIAAGTIIPQKRRNIVEGCGGQFLEVDVDAEGKFAWQNVFGVLERQGIGCVMVEGGGRVINGLLRPESLHLIDSIIVTIAPVWLGQGGVVVSPNRRYGEGANAVPALRLQDPEWHNLGQDVVLCGRPQVP